MRKVLFLDCDGVINDKLTCACVAGFIYADQDKIDRVADIVKETGAVIVLISTWRLDWSKEEESLLATLRKDLAKRGVEIYDKTSLIVHLSDLSFRGNRDKEIRNYLKEHEDIENYVIIDDMYELYYTDELIEHLVITDEFEGLTEEKKLEVIEMLKGE